MDWMRTLLMVAALVAHATTLCYAQTTVKLERSGGVYLIPCTVNGLSLKFIFDTGASDVSLSLTEAMFMLKNGYLKEEDFTGTEKYRVASGEVHEGYTLNLRRLEIAGKVLTNVKASIVKSSEAPLLLGQSALSKLGYYQFDYVNSTLTISNAEIAIDKKKDKILIKISYAGIDYYGMVINDTPNGNGVGKFPNGQVYDGEWLNGKPHGFGSQNWPNGDKYVGYWSGGEINGHGTYTWPNGHKYVGSFVNGKMSYGSYFNPENGCTYVGEHTDNWRTGRGKLTCPNRATYEGDFVLGEMTGRGVYSYPNGDVYRGQMVNGEFHGTGIYTWASGKSYSGKFKKDHPTIGWKSAARRAR
jgi:clan AA aspartic protease (TIGR02281 family)